MRRVPVGQYDLESALQMHASLTSQNKQVRPNTSSDAAADDDDGGGAVGGVAAATTADHGNVMSVEALRSSNRLKYEKKSWKPAHCQSNIYLQSKHKNSWQHHKNSHNKKNGDF